MNITANICITSIILWLSSSPDTTMSKAIGYSSLSWPRGCAGVVHSIACLLALFSSLPLAPGMLTLQCLSPLGFIISSIICWLAWHWLSLLGTIPSNIICWFNIQSCWRELWYQLSRAWGGLCLSMQFNAFKHREIATNKITAKEIRAASIKISPIIWWLYAAWRDPLRL